jgi:soluble lytic murein transglycosylase-like protein
MNHKLTKLAAPIYKIGSFALSGALVFGLFQFPVTSDLNKNSSLEQAVKQSFEAIAESLSTPHAEAAEISLGSIFFGKTALAATEDELIAKKMDFVSTRKAFPASLAVIKKHEKTIREKARANGVPEDVAIGVGLLENGGSETAKSPAGALGVFQLMPGTARALGLTVNKTVDERRDPVKNIDAGMRYLKSNYDRFGDWGLATWAYHAGEGNVSKALQMYAKANSGVSLPGVKEPAKLKEYVLKNKITIDKLLTSAAVKPLTKKLNDDSAGYPYKVIATANLFKAAKKTTAVVPGGIVRNR